MDDTIVVAIWCAVVITALLGYTRYLATQKDISELALAGQASVSGTRKPHETAYYRHRIVSHGFPLLHGLAVKYGYRLRDGNIRDVWSLGVDENKGRSRENKTSGDLENKVRFFENDGKCSFEAGYFQLNAIFKFLRRRVLSLTGIEDASEESEKKRFPQVTIGTAVPVYSWENFVLSMTCFLNNFTLHNFDPHMLQYQTAAKLDVLVVSHKDAVAAVKSHGGSAKYVVVIAGGRKEKEKTVAVEVLKQHYPNVITWDEFLDGKDLRQEGEFTDTEYIYRYDGPHYDEFVPLKETVNYNTTQYTNQNLVSAIAAELKTLPEGHAWDARRDELVILTEDSSLSMWGKVLVGIMLGMSVKVVAPLKLHEITTIDIDDMKRNQEREYRFIVKRFYKTWTAVTKYQNTCSSEDKNKLIGKSIVAVVPSYYLKCIVKHYHEDQFDQLPMLRKMLIGRSQMLLHQGVFSSIGQDTHHFKQLRIVYSVTANTNNVSNNSYLSSWDVSTLRTLMGARVVSERYLAGVIAPLFISNLYDYRIIEEDSQEDGQKAFKEKYIFRGVPSPTVETKLVDYSLLNEQHLADDNEGELCIRGFVIGKVTDEDVVEQKTKEAQRVGGQGWMPTGVVGQFGDDGCFYEKVYEMRT